MRILKWLGSAVLGLLVAFGALFAYVSRSPYDKPEPRTLVAPEEFVPAAPRRPGEHTVVLFVFDGFAQATLRAADAPNLTRMAREGAHTLDMMPVFPSLSMPNHFSLSTGCYPERHGVVSNHFRDPERGIYAPSGDADWLLECEPLHVVAERQGVRAAVFASAAGISSARGKLATIAEPYLTPPLDARAQTDRIIAQLERPADERPGLITAYVNEPDSTSHVHGATAPQTLAIAHELDVQIGRVLAAIERLGLSDRVTLIVTTDHGMLGVDKIVSVERLLRLAGVDGLALAEGSIAHVYLDDAKDKGRAMQALAERDFLDVIDPEAAPAYARLGRSPRVGDFVVSLHPPYFTFDAGFWPWYLRFATYLGTGVSPSKRFAGMHGYDPETVPDVRAIFYAWGRGVQPGVTLTNLRTVDVHPTVARLLDIEPGTPVDGRAHDELFARAPDLPSEERAEAALDGE
jgi:predicted AlkP superfamily pyrophosphatase or phosphodiesterase